MNRVWKSRVIVFGLSLGVWFCIVFPRHWPDLLIGIGAALTVSGLSGGILLKTGRSFHIHRFYYALWYLIVLCWEMTRANLEVARLVLNPRLPIKPGFIRIKTGLQEDSSITVLANSITLTPGTLTVDLDQSRRHLFIHCLVVQPVDLNEETTAIGNRFKYLLQRFMR